jgi:GNAT superfamily N-acetyltransferase
MNNPMSPEPLSATSGKAGMQRLAGGAPSIFVTDLPEAEDVALISNALDEFNVQETGIDDRRPLAVLVRDPETKQVVGGVTGRTSLGLLFLDLFYLPPALRGAGVGSEILRQAEEEGRRRGCRAGVLYTISFQAPGFYRRHGWRVFGEIPCDPAGTSRVFMTKDLA